MRMCKLLYFFISVIVSINAVQVSAIRKAATSAALAGSAAGLVWMGSKYGDLGIENLKRDEQILDKTKITDPFIEWYLRNFLKPMLPVGTDITLCEHTRELADTPGRAIQLPWKNYLSLEKGAIGKLEVQPGTFHVDFYHPLHVFVARHETAHLIYKHPLKATDTMKNVALGAIGLSTFTLAACAKNLKRPLSVPGSAAILAIAPLYYFATESNKAYRERQDEFEADALALKTASDYELASFEKIFKPAGNESSADIYKAAFNDWWNGKLSWNNFYVKITHPADKDRYDAIIAEMNRRSLFQ